MTAVGWFTEAWFGEPAPNGVRIEEVTDHHASLVWLWAAYGHVNPDEFRAAYVHVAGERYDNATPPPVDAVQHAWAVMEPAYPGAPDDEWVFRTDATWATPGALRVTIASCPPLDDGVHTIPDDCTSTCDHEGPGMPPASRRSTLRAVVLGETEG